MSENRDLHWERVLLAHLDYRAAVVLHGNVLDTFPDWEDGRPDRSLAEVVSHVAARAGFPCTEVLDLLTVNRQTPQGGEPGWFDSLEAGSKPPTCYLIENLPVAFPRLDDWSEADWRRHGRLLTALRRLAMRHRVVFTFPDERRIPGNFLAGEPGVVRLHVPLPDGRDRLSFARERMPAFFLREGSRTEKDDEQVRRFAALSEGLHWRDLQAMTVEQNPTLRSNPASLVRRFKLGEMRDHWRELLDDRERLANAVRDIVSPDGGDPLVGQESAVARAIGVVARGSVGLGGITSPNYARPKGVLFFVGPTGVGKTMLAKKLAKLVFGDEGAFLGFDMSEYSEPQSEARLVGAPPGYVGHEAGGQLTTLVQQRPFSVLLFDEIDKAHPSILTKFIQILEEGRLTDGKGQTSYFSDTLIVFTSNWGSQDLPESAVDATPDGAWIGAGDLELERHYARALKHAPGLHHHPEIVNRIGLSNIVPFRHISDVRLVTGAFQRLVARTGDHLAALPKPVALVLEDPQEVLERLADRTKWREFGLRDVRNTFDAEVLEPIALQLVQNARLRRIHLRSGGERLVLEGA